MLLAALFVGCGVSTVQLDDSNMERLDIETPSQRAPAGGQNPLEFIDGGAGGGATGGGFPELGGGFSESTAGGHAGGFPESTAGGHAGGGTAGGAATECTPSQTQTCSTACGSSGTRTCSTDGHWTGACVVPHESCTNGRDDDCDGFTDSRDPDCPPVVHTCESQDGHGCNGDLGYGDHCSAADNTGGCSAQRFWAWCNRRNPASGEIWDNYVRGWVDDRCDGVVQETGTQYSTWYCTSSTNDRYECTTPLVLSFDGEPVRFERSTASFAFTPGAPKDSDWPAAVTPWLARDVNHNGRIDDGSELFGSDTRVGARSAKNGFEALAALDLNGDGQVNAEDPAFDELLVWRDLDGDKRSSAKELVPLRDVGVTSLKTSFEVEPRCDTNGNCERERGAFFMRYGSRGALVDVHLRLSPPLTLVCAMP